MRMAIKRAQRDRGVVVDALRYIVGRCRRKVTEDARQGRFAEAAAMLCRYDRVAKLNKLGVFDGSPVAKRNV